MNLLIDIGGTNIRFIYGNKFKYKVKHEAKNLKDILSIIKKCLYEVSQSNSIDKIIIGIAGIVDNYKLYNSTNLKFLNDVELPKNINNYDAIYFNDGDLSLLGEMYFNKLPKNKNILSLIFGTGVGSGLWINKLVPNCEINKILEKYLGGKVNERMHFFGEHILKHTKKKLVKDLSCIIELLNLDIIVINGFINKYHDLIINKEELLIDNYYKNKIKIIYSDCQEPVLTGCLNFNNLNI